MRKQLKNAINGITGILVKMTIEMIKTVFAAAKHATNTCFFHKTQKNAFLGKVHFAYD
jgi:hypothetical protein